MHSVSNDGINVLLLVSGKSIFPRLTVQISKVAECKRLLFSAYLLVADGPGGMLGVLAVGIVVAWLPDQSRACSRHQSDLNGLPVKLRLCIRGRAFCAGAGVPIVCVSIWLLITLLRRLRMGA